MKEAHLLIMLFGSPQGVVWNFEVLNVTRMPKKCYFELKIKSGMIFSM